MFSTPPWCLPSPSATSRSIRKARPYPLSQPSTPATEPSPPTWPSYPPTTEASTPSPQTPPTSSSTSQATSPPRREGTGKRRILPIERNGQTNPNGAEGSPAVTLLHKNQRDRMQHRNHRSLVPVRNTSFRRPEPSPPFRSRTLPPTGAHPSDKTRSRGDYRPLSHRPSSDQARQGSSAPSGRSSPPR